MASEVNRVQKETNETLEGEHSANDIPVIDWNKYETTDHPSHRWNHELYISNISLVKN